MTITYEYGGGLYVNLTNRCDCACVFCVRTQKAEEDLFCGSLWLPREPRREEALAALLARDLATFNELVFCGYGEPSYRLEDILWLCDQLRATCPLLPPIRLNTNGHGSLINGYDIAPSLSGRLDRVSISLNASTPEAYCALTRPKDGPAAWEALLSFVRAAAKAVPEVFLTVVDYQRPREELLACQALAEELGVPLRIRGYSD